MVNLQEFTADLKKSLEKKKLPFSPELKAYVENHLAVIQEKLSKGEKVKKSDLAFIDFIYDWLSLPDDHYHGSFPPTTFQMFLYNPSFIKLREEAKSKNITILQLTLLFEVRNASSLGDLEDNCEFPGHGNIVIKKDLSISYPSLEALPSGLRIKGCLYLQSATTLKKLPSDLQIDNDLYLSDKAAEQVKEDAKHLHAIGKISGNIVYLKS